MAVLPDACAEWRQLISCELDEELSDTDAARLRRHLRSCPTCVSWIADVDATTALLRSAAHTLPRRRVDLPVIRRRTSRVAGIAAATAAAAMVAVAVVPQASIAPEGSPVAVPGQLAVTSTWTQSHAVLLAAADPWPVPPPHHVTVVTDPF